MNRRVVLLFSVCICPSLSPSGAAEIEPGFISLFDSRSFDGWHSAPGVFKVENRAIVCATGKKGNLLTKRQYADFILRFEFKLTSGANNGLGIRCPLDTTGSLHLEGMELQILDNSSEKYKELKPYQYHGSVYGIVAAKREGLKPVGEWNRQEVTVVGPRVKVVLNGTTIVDANVVEEAARGTLDGEEHPGLRRSKGHIGFLGHGDRIEVRNVRIRDLSGN